MSERHFYRCADCLHVFALDGPKAFLHPDPAATLYGRTSLACDCGSHRIGYMGRVGVDGSVRRIEDRCACDSRCTHAGGPKCNCQCGGANHGTGRTVRVVIDNTAAAIAPQADLEQRRAQRAEFIAARAEAAERINALPFAADVAAGRWIANRAAWERVYYSRKALRAAGNLKTHAARMRAVAKVAQQVQP